MTTGTTSIRSVAGEVIRFGLVGATNTLIYYALYLVLHLAMPYVVAHIMAFAAGMVASFFLNCRFTWRVKPTWKKFLLFPSTTLVNFLVTTFGTVALIEWVAVDAWLAPLIATVVAIPVTFIVTRLVLKGGSEPAVAGTTAPVAFADQPTEELVAEIESSFTGVAEVRPTRSVAESVDSNTDTGQLDLVRL